MITKAAMTRVAKRLFPDNHGEDQEQEIIQCVSKDEEKEEGEAQGQTVLPHEKFILLQVL